MSRTGGMLQTGSQASPTRLALRASYDAAGRMTKRTDPNGVVMTYAYDNVNRVLDVNATRGTTPIADYAYQRDQIGRVATLTELSGRVVTYGYSVPGRLVNETITGEPHGINGSIGYTHDAVGNRLTRTSTVGPVAGQAFAYDANDRITTETYDLNGNTLQAEGDSFAYDFADRLVGIGSGVGIAYDGIGDLLWRSEGGVSVGYLVDDSNPTGWSQVVEEVVGGAVSKRYSFGRTPLRSGGQSYVADGHTDVRLLTDSSGTVSDEYDYEAFGVGTRTSGSSVNPLRYTGERAEAGDLTFFRARHMKKGTGRFLNPDPSRAERNLYSFAQMSPGVLFDRSGLLAEEPAVAGAGLGIAATNSTVGYSGLMLAARIARVVIIIAPILPAAPRLVDLAEDPNLLPQFSPKGPPTKQWVDKYPPGTKKCPTHHIVPKKKWSADLGRQILGAAGIGVHDSENLIGIDGPTHSSMHTDAYVEYVHAMLVQATSSPSRGFLMQQISKDMQPYGGPQIKANRGDVADALWAIKLAYLGSGDVCDMFGGGPSNDNGDDLGDD